MVKYKLKDCFKSRASPQSYYPLWRRPLSTISFYILWIIANLGLKNSYILSFMTLILGFTGCLFISTGYLVTGSIILIFSYIFDLLDGKLARLLNKSNKNAKFIDWTYHSLIPTLAIFSLGIYLLNITNSIFYVLIAGGSAIVFLHKNLLSFLYLNIKDDIDIEGDKNHDFEKRIENIYSLKKCSTRFKLFYNTFIRLFVDSTDVLFGIMFFSILKIVNIYLILFFFINTLLWLYSFYTKFRDLYIIEMKIKIK